MICYRNQKELQKPVQLTIGDVVSSIYSLDQHISNALGNRKLSVASSSARNHHELEQLNGPDSDYNSANDDEESAVDRTRQSLLS